MKRSRQVGVALVGTLTFLILIGCSSPQRKAQKLYDQGKYEEVIEKYPDLPIAVRARETLAENLYREGKYTELVEQYPESPYAVQAREILAEKLLADARKEEDVEKQKAIYRRVLQKYPRTEAAAKADSALSAQENEVKLQ